jgi:hypothetical protein
MADEALSDRSWERRLALSRWENEGGSARLPANEANDAEDELAAAPVLTNTELVQLRIRVIALENLVISLLARASIEQPALVREMAAYISPRPGFTQHPLTIRAAEQMLCMLERSSHFRA